MSRSGHTSSGMGLAPRFAIAMSLALAVVMGCAMLMLFGATSNLVETTVTKARDEAAQMTVQLKHKPNSPALSYTQTESEAVSVGSGVLRFHALFESGPQKG